MKLADNDSRHKRLKNMTNGEAGKIISEILTRFVTQSVRMDKRLKMLVDNAPGTLGQVIATMPTNLQSEATTVIALLDGIGQSHKATGD